MFSRVCRDETAVMAPTTVSSLTSSVHRPLISEVPTQNHTATSTARPQSSATLQTSLARPWYAATCGPESGLSPAFSLATHGRTPAANSPAMVPLPCANDNSPSLSPGVALPADAPGLLSPTVKGSTGSVRAATEPLTNGVGMARAAAVHPALARFISPSSGVPRGVSTYGQSTAPTAVSPLRKGAVGLPLPSPATLRRVHAVHAFEEARPRSAGEQVRHANVNVVERMYEEASSPTAPSLANRSSPHGEVHRVGISHAPSDEAGVAMANPVAGAKRARNDVLLPRSLHETINVINNEAAQRTCTYFILTP